MHSFLVKLERLLKQWRRWGRRQAREPILGGLVTVNGRVEADPSALVGAFDKVLCQNQVVQDRQRRSLILHKPRGVVSSTQDAEYETVIDLIARPWAGELHLAGRLDRFTSGLMVLTNDSALSERLTLPGAKLGKRYRVTCDAAISEEMVSAFQSGMWFAKEGITTQSARVVLIEDNLCQLTIFEGKHHQVKRMFARFGVKVTALHREAMGPLELDGSLSEREWRDLTEVELHAVWAPESASLSHRGQGTTAS